LINLSEAFCPPSPTFYGINQHTFLLQSTTPPHTTPHHTTSPHTTPHPPYLGLAPPYITPHYPRQSHTTQPHSTSTPHHPTTPHT
jgi:hypothetical protein